MDNEGANEFSEAATEEESVEDNGQNIDPASRARNKTVMLTPEVTGQLRALLNRENGSSKQSTPDNINPLSDILPPIGREEPASVVADPLEGIGRREATIQSGELPVLSGGHVQSATQNGEYHSEQSVADVSEEPHRSVMAKPVFAVNPAATANSVFNQQNTASARSVTSKIVGFLINFDDNEYGDVIEIRKGRWLLTSRPTDQGNYIIVDDPSISPLHAIIRATDSGSIQILDQLSEHGTGVISSGEEEEVDIAGTMVNVSHGDLVRFGLRYYIVCVVPEVSIPDAAEDA